MIPQILIFLSKVVSSYFINFEQNEKAFNLKRNGLYKNDLKTIMISPVFYYLI